MVVIIITTCKTSHFSKVKILDACFMLHLVRRKKTWPLAWNLSQIILFSVFILNTSLNGPLTLWPKTTAKKLWQLVYSWGMMRNDSSEKLSKADTEEKSILYESD